MAWTERYVRADAAGGGNGTTDANSGANGAWTLAEGITNEAAGMRVNIKAGTYANTTTSRTWAAAGTATAPIWWRGFKTTAGDLDARPVTSLVVSTDMPHITFTSGVATSTGANHRFSSISFLATTATGACFRTNTGDQHEMHRCRFENQNAGAGSYGLRCSTVSSVHECYIKATSSAIAGYFESSRSFPHACVIVGGANGAYFGSTGNCFGNIFDSPAGDAIVLGPTNVDFIVAFNTIYNPTGHGILIPASYSTAVRANIFGNLFHTITGSGKAGIKNNDASAYNNVYRWGNAYYNVTTPESGFGDTPDYDRISEGSDPLTNPASDDFSYKTTADGFQAGTPGLFEGLTIASYASPGAQIPDEVSSGGGSGPPANLLGGIFQ